jgi:trimeric autotransporter adhesin
MKIIKAVFLIILPLVYIGLLPGVQAVVPPPDGGYPGFNTAEGTRALFSLTTGSANTAVGWFSLFSNAENSFNTATGVGTLLFNTADNNAAFGAAALLFNTIGEDNTAVGTAALLHNTEGSRNTADGRVALFSNTIGNSNTASGFEALFSNDNGIQNTANGASSLASNISGDGNTATGANALHNSTIGDFNTALGIFAGTGVSTASNVIAIGTPGANVDNSCFIGNIYTNVQPIVGTDPDSVTITSTGRLGRGNVSSRRYKHDIEPMEKASEALYALKPASFRYNKEYDATQTLAFGLIAEEVAEVIPDLVGRNPKGEPESVRYEQINAMLLNEFLKEHRKVEEQGKEIDALKRELTEQRDLIQKVSDRVEMTKPAELFTKNP